jgi:hypothetical protein
MPILIRILGITALILCVIPFQFKKHKHIVLCKMASELMFAAQYFLMGPHAYTGACLDLISGGRNFLFYKLVEKKKSTTPVILIFSAFMIVLGIVTWASWLSLLPVCAKIISTISYGMHRERLLRYITLPSCILWIIYNITVGGWEAMISDGLSLISILIAIWKFDIHPKATEQ